MGLPGARGPEGVGAPKSLTLRALPPLLPYESKTALLSSL